MKACVHIVHVSIEIYTYVDFCRYTNLFEIVRTSLPIFYGFLELDGTDDFFLSVFFLNLYHSNLIRIIPKRFADKIKEVSV